MHGALFGSVLEYRWDDPLFGPPSGAGVVLGEYCFGIRQWRHRSRYEDWLARCLPLTEIGTVTSATADTYADIRLELKRLGSPIPPNGVWIAAPARQHGLAILSNDGHFDVSGHYG